MTNKINFITGETYTLAELFSGERRIIIPDLQRDYCWGDENNVKSTEEKGELVTDFVNNLLTQFEEYKNDKDKGSLNLGLFYGYEVPANHIQLCDGQQRLTTLYILLGMINKETYKFRQSLISDFEYKHDDKEPYLNYAIRESSLYFLSDLVCQFFIDNESDKVEDIKNADWYFADYDLDPSIQSILRALSKIQKIFDENRSLDFRAFGEWLLNKVTFLYFDMENRKNGEETFVVINTTGEALSSTQNLKPLVLQEKNDEFDNITFNFGTKCISECWEEIETWFWKQRKGDNDTADVGFAEFLRWISIIEQVDVDAPEEEKTDSIKKLFQLILQGKKCDFPYKTISFETIYNYWKAICWIADNVEILKLSFAENYLSPAVNKDVNNRNAIGQNDCFVLLPVLKYVYKNIVDIESNPTKQRNAKRIYEFFKNMIRIDNVSKAVNTLVGDAIKIINLLPTGDLVSLVDGSVDISEISKQILTDEEKRKLGILNKSTNRNDIEEAFWSTQEHKIWNGEILPMIEWSTDDNGFCLDTFQNYKSLFAKVFTEENNADNAKIDDTVRRALLTRGLEGYPRIFKGYTNISFGWDWSDWHVLIKDNSKKFQTFFDDLLKGIDLRAMINSYSDTHNPYYRFVQYPELMKYCGQKNIQIWDKSYCIVKQQRATNYLELETFCLYLDLYPAVASTPIKKSIALRNEDGIDLNSWKMWLWQEGNKYALVFDKDWNGLVVAIDVYYNRMDEKGWKVQLFLRPGKGNTETDLKGIASSCGLNFNGDRYELSGLSRQEVIDKINNLLKVI